MKKFILMLCFYYLNLSAQITINGNNFTNLIDARNYVRTINATMTNNIIVNIAPGTYILNETLEFMHEDSGKNGYNIIYQAADIDNKPIISGGQKITGTWTLVPNSNNIWQINIGSLYSRQIYVNGVKAKKASSENLKLVETTNGYISTCSNTNFANWGSSNSLTNLKDMEVVANSRWRSSRIPVESVCGKQLIINNKFWQYIHSNSDSLLFKRHPALRLENAFELIDTDGAWYIKKNTNSGNILYYKPVDAIQSSLALNNLNFIIPKLDSLISGDTIENIKFINLDFRYNKWNKPSEPNTYVNTGLDTNNGLYVKQADIIYETKNDNSENNFDLKLIPSALVFKYAENISFLNCTFSNLGSSGLAFLVGSKNNSICGNTFKDIAASGIYLGDIDNASSPCLNPMLPPPSCSFTVGSVEYNNEIKKIVENNSILKNKIENVGTEYYSSCGILVSFAKNTKINFNTLSHFPYTGISLGWGWNRGFNHGTNEIKNNYIDCSSQILPDGGGIYTLSSQGTDLNRTKIENNYILNQKFYRGAIYLDQGSSYIDVKNNLIDTNYNATTQNQLERGYECTNENGDGIIRPIECWNNSQNVSIVQNFYNLQYTPLSEVYPFNVSVCDNLNQNFPSCSNIIISGNNPFESLNNIHITIINNSGINSPSTLNSTCN